MREAGQSYKCDIRFLFSKVLMILEGYRLLDCKICLQWEDMLLKRLPGPGMDFWDWQFDGACVGMSESIFFHPEGERGKAKTRRDDNAKLICSRCKVLEKCKQFALSTHEPYGVWGGLSEEELDFLTRLKSRDSL